MNINLVTDAPKHNLALMKFSAYHKNLGDNVYLNFPGSFDKVIGSWLFKDSSKVPCDLEGGPGASDGEFMRLEFRQDASRDYDLFGLDFSLGYTWAYCPRQCNFCVVPDQHNDKEHFSIWSFHLPKFNKICLLNNNTFSDPQWKETFEEIWDANLTVIDENGYDLRLIDDEKAHALKKTKFQGYIHYAWDDVCDDTRIVDGLKIAPKGMVYVLVGYDEDDPDTIQPLREEDFYRCQVINDMGFDPYVMPYNRGTPELRRFKRFIDTRSYRKYKTLKDGYKDYK